ncbi:hypothetical protein DRF60_06870 [Chryseobacterium elymi]|uniref:Uncharacterized protein n=1 Tax=Chryseobacterium elymi TaxID=395936 RepID=A0A3D9DNE8_9FLAO|nr:hypothetical protein [Chryseobacterium elymi]REC79538.1 hypothetical protein DRF60_06870 [Chryseobacterium elymi]
MKTLNEKMKDWTDADIAMHEIALKLELIPEDNFPKFKSYYWSGTEKSKALKNILNELTNIGFLDFNTDENTFKINQEFCFEK